jgi:pimeloyl-ACP methyl ester carboxylesterase
VLGADQYAVAMSLSARNHGYAPRGLTTDEKTFGLKQSEVRTEFGSAVARSKQTTRSKRATIFLHGAAGSWTTWTPLLAIAEEAGIVIENPVLLDLPGWGDGTLTASGEDAAIESVCSLVRASAEQLGYTEWDLVGHSMGGFIAMHMAAIWPEAVLSVGTVSATGWSVIDAIQHPILHFARLPGFIGLWAAMGILAPLGRTGTGFVRGMRRVGLLRPATRPLFRFPSRIAASVIYALGDELRPRSFRIATSIAHGYDASAWWATIGCPVRALQGDHDVFARESDLVGLGTVLPMSVRLSLRDCGHFGLIERPWDVLVGLGFAAAD